MTRTLFGNTGRMTTRDDDRHVPQLQQLVDRLWQLLPKAAEKQLLELASPTDVAALTNFWFALTNVWFSTARSEFNNAAKRNRAASWSCASWLLALGYLELGKTEAARVLTLNGAFLCQYSDKSDESIAKLFDEKERIGQVEAKRLYDEFNSPIFSTAFFSLRTPQTIHAYCLKQIPPGCQVGLQRVLDAISMPSPGSSSDCNVMQYVDRLARECQNTVKANRHTRMQRVDQIRDSWCSDSSAKNYRTGSSKTKSTGTQIQLILACGANDDDRRTLSIGSSTNLKTLFNDYAKERGDSLRSLRFSFRGKTLFLSSVGNKTPDELNMKDQDVIGVHVTSTIRDTGCGCGGNSSTKKSTPALQEAKATKNHTRKRRVHGKKKKKYHQEPPVKTLQEWKAEHSNKLSKIHEEVHQRLKDIRTKLNALDLKRQPSKQQRKKRRNAKNEHKVDIHHTLPPSLTGGKAGKSFFDVQIGEVQNLYKTSRKTWRDAPHHRDAALLDLHGHTREEALRKLDDSLPRWMDAAMRGSYPFVMPVRIVCGGGHQLLSETVEKWIRGHEQVANAIRSPSP